MKRSLTAALVPLTLVLFTSSLPLALARAAAISASEIAAAATTVDASDPGKLIETASQAMLRELDAHRAEYRRDPRALRELIDAVLLAHFDTEYAGRQVLGTEWRNATPEQRRRFVAGFYQSMLSNYGNALLDFTGDRLKVLPYRGEPGQKSALVQTTVRKSDGTQVAVNYSLRLTDQGWKAWDVRIEGISYVKSFRDDFAAEIAQKGLDAVIARLESQAAAGDAKPAAGE